ncbi:hypothetical protein [Clavibacter michiganensis]|uniref:hypothetical protein n=1 Tax=Clavibacter michiganensis TaxID=28447 RepID=UPI0009A5A3E7|nr:hypothetical protein [Clavibacter michiganensis]MBE3077610.1 hypothetical protein [Clavibacter michiganensis subsp. michiganensis]MBF4636469.1 hypothetical protein [Clavibacter michiganensis subsp. michiganensis]MDO4123818.1 hypothetical protein [Clavibacter michiganensis]MDO4138842.1 hypothetical protein [Clavibacter michiganensis]MWJ07099.1 hypothetical protein [Clavibacter michiganensis subsp. michiganensis]
MWIDDDGTVSSMWVSGSFRLLPWRARWALWTAELDELADDVTALETAVGNAASCRREWPDQSAYRMREIPRELRGGFRGLRDFADVREHLLSFPLALSMQWQTDVVQVAVDVVDTVRRSTRRRLLARGARIAASRLRIPVIGRSETGPPLARRIAPLDACAAPGQLVDDDGEPLRDPSRSERLAAARARAEG